MHEQAQFVVGWGTLSLINAGLAQAKGRSGLLWWLVSLILGPTGKVVGDHSSTVTNQVVGTSARRGQGR